MMQSKSIGATKEQILSAEGIESYIKITTDAGVTAFEVFRVDLTNDVVQVYDNGVVGNWKTLKAVTGSAYDVLGLVFDLVHSPTAGKDFNTLDGAAGTISFFVVVDNNGNSVQVGAGKAYTQGNIQSVLFSVANTGNTPIDILSVYDKTSVYIVTSAALTNLEIPVGFVLAQRG